MPMMAASAEPVVTSTRAIVEPIPYEDETTGGPVYAEPVVMPSSAVRAVTPGAPVYVHPQAGDWWYSSALAPSPTLGSRLDYQTLVRITKFGTSVKKTI